MAAKGITQEEVFAAADKLLIDGAQPTIEKIRLELGTGSPNTVTPMLRAWFKNLGERIRDPAAFAATAAPAAPELPGPIHQAAMRLWQAAKSETMVEFDERLAEKLADGMKAAVANVEAEKERAALAEAAAFSAAALVARLERELETANNTFETANGLLVTERASHIAASTRLQQAMGRIAELDASAVEGARLLDEARKQALDRVEQARQETRRLVQQAEERSDGAQRRAALEIEAARTAKTQAEKRLESVEQRLEAATAQANDAKTQALNERTELLRAADRAAERASSEISGIRGQLAASTAQVATLTAEVERLTTLLSQRDRELADAVARAETAASLWQTFGNTNRSAALTPDTKR